MFYFSFKLKRRRQTGQAGKEGEHGLLLGYAQSLKNLLGDPDRPK